MSTVSIPPATSGGIVTNVSSNVPVAEAGQTTSEFKATIGGAVVSAIALAVSFGAPLNGQQQNAIIAFVATIGGLVGTYSLSRGFRKSGSNG